MALLECVHLFQGFHRKADEPYYDHAFEDLRSLHRDGLIDGSFRVRVSDRQDSAEVFVTIWRDGKVWMPAGWMYRFEGVDALPHRYDRSFNPGQETPGEVVYAIKQFVFTPLAAGAKCVFCRDAIDEGGGYRILQRRKDVENQALAIGFAPLCAKHLTEHDSFES